MDINRNNTGVLLRFGAHSAGVIPVPIPNTEVKPSRADYTALRETRKVPNYGETTRKSGFFLCDIIFLWLEKQFLKIRQRLVLLNGIF